MPKPRKASLEARKRPSQARSKQLVEDILQAAIRVLTGEGAAALTTIRVAEVAGVSVGSLYQYFPNRESLLFAIQEAEWRQTFGELERCLLNTKLPLLERMRAAIVVFYETENKESDLRSAMDTLGDETWNTPESVALRERAYLRMNAFIGELAPHLAQPDREFHAVVVMTTISATAERATRRLLGTAEMERWAHAAADMVVGYLERLAQRA